MTRRKRPVGRPVADEISNLLADFIPVRRMFRRVRIGGGLRAGGKRRLLGQDQRLDGLPLPCVAERTINGAPQVLPRLRREWRFDRRARAGCKTSG